MKKIACLCLVVVNLFLLCLTGCGKTEKTEEKATPASDFKYRVFDGEWVSIVDYLKDDEEVIIPEKIDGVPVVNINAYAFRDKSLKSVTIPDTVEHIRENAFYNCANLVEVKFGKCVTEIESNAFRKCIALEKINFPESLEKISIAAFADCSGLKEITIPKNVTQIEAQAFYLCTSLEQVTISGSSVRMYDNVFVGCIALKTVKFLENAPKYMSEFAFGINNNENITCYYKKGTTGWDNEVFENYNLAEYSE